MQKLKFTLLTATMIAGMAAAPAFAQVTSTGGTPTFTDNGATIAAESVTVTNSAVPGVTTANTGGNGVQTYETASSSINLFAIYAPGLPQSNFSKVGSANVAGTPDGLDMYGNPTYSSAVGGVTFDGDFALHGAGATSIQNVLVRAMNCFGTPSVLANGQPGPAGALSGAALKVETPGSYAGVPTMACNNGVIASYAVGAAPAGSIALGSPVNGSQYYWTPAATKASVYEIQPQFNDYSTVSGNLTAFGFSGKYIGSGSGLGQAAWEFATDVFDDQNGLVGQNTKTGVPNTFVTQMGYNRWSHVQFAMSDAPITASNLTLYNNAANAVAKGGPAVQIPLFVLPVAIAYNSVYGEYITASGTHAAGTLLTFNAKANATYGTTKVPSLQMSASVYCGIFNGMITNWNDQALTVANKNTPLYDIKNDTAARWSTQGAPIRLVARMDNSGTTDVFSRHLAQVCSQAAIYGSSFSSNYYTGLAAGVASLLPVIDKKNFVPNRYLQNAQSMPYNAGPNFTQIRADTHLNGSAYSASNDAGSVNMISGDYYNNGVISNIADVDAAHNATRISSTPTNYNGSALFIVANGGGDVAKLINLTPDYKPSGSAITFNGKVGYISADYVSPSVDAPKNTTGPGTLVAALLAVLPNSGATNGIYPYTYYAPTVKNALAAFNNNQGTLQFLPPESDNTGLFVPATTPLVASASGGFVVRSNPLAWTDAFYPAGSTSANYGTYSITNAAGTSAFSYSGTYTLAQPFAGFPIVGTTQMLTYTCFATAGNRQAIADLVGTLTSQLKVDSTNTKINKTAFTSPTAATLGIIAQSNIGIVPAAWQLAIANTFLNGSSDVNTSTSGGQGTGTSAGTGYAAFPLNLTSALVPTKVKVAGITTYTPTVNNGVVCNSEGNVATASSVVAGTNTGL